MSEQSILSVKNLTKYFDKFCAVDHISFSVPKGKVIGLLGPNGAGKTTTIQMLLGITTQTGGDIEYFGKDFKKNRQFCLSKINHASAFNTLQGRITVWENLLTYAMLYGIKNHKQKILKLVDNLEISDLLNKDYWDLSTGQRTRVNIVKSLLNDPQILLMDEPTASLDPDIADKTLSLIENLRKEYDLSILYTSHEMDEVTRLCDEVIFLDRGKIVAQDTPVGLTKKIKYAKVKLIFTDNKEVLEKFLQKHDFKKYEFLTKNNILIESEEKQIPKLIFEISKLDINVTDIEIIKPTLEDVFLQIARGEHNVT